MFSIHHMHVSVADTPILNGVTLSADAGEIHVLMGPNGSGKSTLAQALMGHPQYTVTNGNAQLNETDLMQLEPHERAQHGLFLAFQYPTEVEGVTLQNFLWTAYKHIHNVEGTEHVKQFRHQLHEHMDALEIPRGFLQRQLNADLSGGEKKRCEILQLLILDPKVVILDETDSGLDVDSIRLVANAIQRLRAAGKTVLVITHYRRIVDHIAPDTVHILSEGQIATSGDSALLDRVEEEGYAWVKTAAGKELTPTEEVSA